MKKTPAYWLILLSICIILGSCSNPAGGSGADPKSSVFSFLYVVEAAAGTGDGSSWDNAMDDVQAAIEAAAGSGKTHVLIKAGVYYPRGYPNLSGVQTDERLKHFSLRNGVTVIGGFRGDEEDANPLGGATTLSGSSPGLSNVFRVFYHPDGTGLDNTAVLKNVTITGGNGTGSGGYYGGGMHNANSSPVISNCAFLGNSAVSGGGMYNSGSSPVIISSIFAENSAIGSEGGSGRGGGVYNSGSTPVFTNCTFYGNSADWSGGGMSNTYSHSPVLINCTFSGNSAESGGGMYNDNSSPQVFGSIFAGNYLNNGNTSEIEGDNINSENTDNLIRGTNYSGILRNLFAETAGAGHEEHGVLNDNGGPTASILINAIPEAQITLPVSWSYTGYSEEVYVPMSDKDQRGYTRPKTENIGYIGAVDPRIVP